MILKREKFREFYSNIPIYIFALALILAGVFFLLFLEKFKTYNTEISVIFIPQNEKIAEQTSQIAENLTIIPTKLSFYERLLSDNKDIEDQFIGFSNDKRKELWNKTIQVEREKNSTIINIEASDRFQSQKLAKQTAFTLFNVMSRYYNIKTDIDFRIIEGPITSAHIKNWPLLTLSSLILGMILALLINIVSLNIASLFKKQNEIEIPVEKIFQSFPKPDFPKKEYPEAPVDLPIAKELAEEPETTIENIYPLEDLEIEKPKEVFKKEEEIFEKREPTEEELKERLNQLLRGDL
jgi:capsular polysaccharide biosynthesis protein